VYYVRAAIWPPVYLDNVVHDTRFAYRMARRNPGFTALAVLTLAVGVGSTTSIFSVVKAVLLNQLPNSNPDRVVALAEVDPADPSHFWRATFPHFAQPKSNPLRPCDPNRVTAAKINQHR